jgi:hypothetical protein
MDSIFNIAEINECVSELAKSGLIKILSEQFQSSNDKDVIRSTMKILDKVVSIFTKK